MKGKDRKSLLARQISLLIVTDSPPLREALGNIVKKTNALRVAGEARNNSQAFDMLKGFKPDVVLLDPGVPALDDIPLLQNIMIHQATPVIILPNLSEMGLKQSFSALTNGAVDFIYKESIYSNQGDGAFQKEVLGKVTSASRMDVTLFAVPHVSSEKKSVVSTEKETEIVFCEECGARNIFEISQHAENSPRYCSECDDLLENHLIPQHKRTHYVTVIAAGTGSYTNLLKIIPKVPTGMSGAVIIVVYDDVSNVAVFAEYLDTISSVQVLRLENGMSIEGGNCYVAAASENFYMKSHSTRNLMERATGDQEDAPVDLLMQSVSDVFKKNSAGLVLSGSEQDAEKGLKTIKRNDGISAVLFAPNCLHRQMGENALRRCRVDKIVDEHDATKFISELHDSARDSVSTA